MDEQKKQAGEKAAEYVKDGMVVALGTGSTVHYTLQALKGKNIIGVCTSVDTEKKCADLGIKIGSINEHTPELAIDGADEIDKNNCLIKGGGGALTREKIIDYRAKEFIVIADESKLVEYLGQTFALPVEVMPFAWKAVQKDLKEYGEPTKRDYTTDNSNYIIDVKGEFREPAKLEKEINNIPGVVENGLFTKKVKRVIIGDKVME